MTNLTTPVPPPPPPARARAGPSRNQPLLIVAGIVVGLLVGGRVILSLLESSSSQESTKPTVISPKIGDTVAVGYWTYRVWDTEWRSSLGDGDFAEHPDAMFLVVEITVQNNDNTGSNLPPLILLDAQNREYSESGKSWQLGERSLMFKTLNPAVQSHGFAVFDVPRGEYKLKVSGGFTSGKWMLIDLQK